MKSKIFFNIFILLLVVFLCLGCNNDSDKDNENNNDDNNEIIDDENNNNEDINETEEKQLEVSELKEKLIALVNEYMESLNGSIDVKLTYGSESYDIVLKYDLSSKDIINSYEYKVVQIIDGKTIEQYTYVKNNELYMMANGMTSVEDLTQTNTKYLLNNCSVDNVINKVLPFYNEDSFYDLLVFSKRIDDDTFAYKYNSITLEVTLKEGNIVSLEFVSEENNMVSKSYFRFNGLEKPIINYPSDIS